MGFALIIPNIDFSSANIGRVTPAEDVPLVSLSISGLDSVIGADDAATYLAVYNPANTNQRAVSWSISSGGTYATIDASTGALTILSGAIAAAVTIRVQSLANPLIFAEKNITVTYSASTEPVHTGAAYFMPLKTDSTPTEGSLTVSKEDTSFSQDGALFDSVGEGICYAIPVGESFAAIAFSFKKMSLGLSASNYFLLASPYPDENGPGIGLYTDPNGNNVGSTAVSDFTFASNAFTLGEWHRACVAIINGSLYLYIDGVQVGSAHSGFTIGSTKSWFILGNNWRYRESDGDRVFGGYIKDVAVWTSEINESDMVDFSTL